MNTYDERDYAEEQANADICPNCYTGCEDCARPTLEARFREPFPPLRPLWGWNDATA